MESAFKIIWERVGSILLSRAFRRRPLTSPPKIVQDQILWSSSNVRILLIDLESLSYSSLENGTVDWAAYLGVSAALDFRKWLGGESLIDEYGRNLAIEGGEALVWVLNMAVMDGDCQFAAHMVHLIPPLELLLISIPKG